VKKGQNLNHPEKGSTVKVEPIRQEEDVHAILNMLADHPRNLALFTVGTHTNLRPAELLGIKVGQVLGTRPGVEMEVRESRTGRKRRIPLDRDCVSSVQGFLEHRRKKEGGEPDPAGRLFTGLRGPLSVQTVHNLVKGWCSARGLAGNYGSHTLRKTFGYHQLLDGRASLADLMTAFGHSTPHQTLEYLCIRPEEAVRCLATGPSKSRKPSYEELEREVRMLRMRAEKTKTAKPGLLESEEKYRVIFENANDLIVYTDLEGRFIELNNKLEEIFGYKREDFVGRNFSEVGVLGPRDLNKAWRDLRNTIAGKPPQVSEFEVFRRDGTKASVEVNSRLIKIDGQPKASILIIRDITERKKAEEALRKVHEELEQKVRERTLNLEEANTALRVLLRKRDEDRVELEERMLTNLKELILPYLEKMKRSRLDERQKTLLEIIESNLHDILSPLARHVSKNYLNFTPTEIQVASLVRNGRTTKEIGDLLGLSTKTIEFHRENIRSKVGIKNKKVNLRTHLLSFPDSQVLPRNIPVKI